MSEGEFPAPARNSNDVVAWHRLVWPAVLLGIVVRVAWALWVPVEPVSDSLAYDSFAQSLLTGRGFAWSGGEPTAYWPPGTSFLYAGLYWLFGVTYVPIVVVNIAMGAAIIWQTARLAYDTFGVRAAAVAALAMALWPVHVEFTTILASELPYTALTLGGVLCWRMGSDRTAWRALATGVLFAAACYVRPTAAPVPVLLAAIEFLRYPNRARTVVHAAMVGMVMIACLAPWCVRNSNLFGRFVSVSTNAGANLWMGNNPSTSGMYQPVPDLPGLNEAERDRELGRQAREFIRERPLAFAGRTAVKLARLHERQTIGIAWNKDGLARVAPAGVVRGIKIFGQVYWLGALGAALVGLAVACRAQGAWSLLLSPPVTLWAFTAVVYAIIVVQDRYLIPATPMIAGLTGVGATWMWARARRMGVRPVGLETAPPAEPR